MGIHGNATCQMNLDGATGWLIGQPNKGLNAMFVMMNAARLGVGMQSLGLTEVAYQNALVYAKDRLQMRSLSGVEGAGQAGRSDHRASGRAPHAADRASAYAEGGRAFCSYIALQIDRELNHPDEEVRKEAADEVALLTPIVKAFLTDNGWIATSEAMQVYGGHGYIAEWGMEQYVRDARINMIYEGTNTIQSLDLLGRKILMDNGAKLRKFGAKVQAFVEENGTDEAMSEFITPLGDLGDKLTKLTMEIGMKAFQNPGRSRRRRRALPARGRPSGVCLFLRADGEDRAGEAGFRRQLLQGQAGDRAFLLRAPAAGNRDADPPGALRVGQPDGAGRRSVLIVSTILLMHASSVRQQAETEDTLSRHALNLKD